MGNLLVGHVLPDRASSLVSLDYPWRRLEVLSGTANRLSVSTQAYHACGLFAWRDQYEVTRLNGC